MEELGFPFESEYFESQSLFEEFPETTPKEVTVWTESDDDIRLWMQVFVDNQKFKFIFLSASKFKSANGVSSNGCSRLLKLCETKEIITGKQNIVCLDSDFKFVAQQSSDYNGKDYSAPHFYWTNVHSKEHIFLDCDVVDDIVSHSSCTPATRLQQRTKEIYCNISQQVYGPLSSIIYLMSISFEHLTEEVEQFKVQFRDGLFLLLQLKSGLLSIATCQVWRSFSGAMHELDIALKKHISENNKIENLSEFRQGLSGVGITSGNIYLFIRGHDWESVAKHLAKCHLDFLQELKFKDIRETSKEIEKDIQAVRNKTPRFDQAILSIKPKVDNFPFFKSTLEAARSVYGGKSEC